MKPFSLSILLALLFISHTTFAQKFVDEQTLVEVAKEKAAKKRAYRQAYFAKHPDRYDAEKEDFTMDNYERRLVREARQLYEKMERKERILPIESLPSEDSMASGPG